MRQRFFDVPRRIRLRREDVPYDAFPVDRERYAPGITPKVLFTP
jgi:hypothetical protein